MGFLETLDRRKSTYLTECPPPPWVQSSGCAEDLVICILDTWHLIDRSSLDNLEYLNRANQIDPVSIRDLWSFSLFRIEMKRLANRSGLFGLRFICQNIFTYIIITIFNTPFYLLNYSFFYFIYITSQKVL